VITILVGAPHRGVHGLRNRATDSVVAATGDGRNEDRAAVHDAFGDSLKGITLGQRLRIGNLCIGCKEVSQNGLVEFGGLCFPVLRAVAVAENVLRESVILLDGSDSLFGSGSGFFRSSSRVGLSRIAACEQRRDKSKRQKKCH